MAENKITIHQAFYGEANRAHSCIKQTISDPELTSFLIAFTDRPAALPPGVNLLPYLSGSAFAKYYILTKTFPDSTATRAGMVFTHVLIFKQAEIISIDNLQSVLSLFIESTDNKKDELKEFQIEISDTNFNATSKHQPKYIQQVISAFITGMNPILFSGDIPSFSHALQQIWNSPNVLSRKTLKFRTSFTFADIENVNDLTIVSIQKDFLPKWQGQNIIHGESQEIVEITSHSEALFLGYKEENPFHNFLVELNVSLAEVQSYGQYEKIFNNYVSIDKVDDANILRQDVRVLSKISPSPTDGKRVKEKFIERLSALLQTKKDINLKALRNLNWSAFEDGERKGKHIVSLFIASELQNPNQKQFQHLAELIDLSVAEEDKNWWHNSISETVDASFKKQNETSLKNIWHLIDSSEQTLKNLLSIISSVKDCESVLRNFIPEKLRVETCKILAPIVQKKNWFLLHADVLLKQHTIESSLEKQLEVEKNLSLADSVGVEYLVEKLTPEKLLEVTLKTGHKKLIEFSVGAIINNVSLLKDIDLAFSCWLDIWTSFVLKTREIFSGLTGKEQAIVFSVLDLIVNGKTVNDILVGLIANTAFADISEYKNRSKVWGVVNHLQKEKFLAATTKSVLKNLLTGKIKSNTIEAEITGKITSDFFMTNFLSENRNNIEPVLIVFSSFASLKDNFLSDYIANYKGAISEGQATKLGALVNSNKFKKTARSIYDKSKYNPSFTPAYELCRELVSLNWWESILSFGSQPSKPSHSFSIPALSMEESVRANLPTVVILTAIKDEYMAVREHLNETVDADRNDTSYEAGLFQFNSNEIAKVVIRECGAKNTNAAQETERAIQYFKPDMILFVGIAGSRKPKDFAIGDVIFPEKVYSYEGGKSEKESFLSRPDNALMSYSLLEKAKKERKKEDWKILIRGNWNQDVKADIGIIASGEQVVEHYGSEIGKILHDHFNDTSAVEMEGFGFGKAANRQGRETSNILVGVVRGISDIIEQSGKKEKEKVEDKRPASAKRFASATAAAFAFWLILKTYKE